MEKDVLLLLKPDFMDGVDGPFYCPESAPLEGVLSYYPRLRTELDVRYLEFPRPRKTLVDLLGEEHQGLPVLVLRTGVHDHTGAKVSSVTGRRFIADPDAIRQYLTVAYGAGRPHGHALRCP